ncbi:MAG TPA: hypothetical protein VJR02_01495 [Pyrinomonadaceae bacterium]|nr:hypothetical protein [Pyrinomonadaceae bacterium]
MEVPVVEIKEIFEGLSRDQWANIDKRLRLFYARYYEDECRLNCEELIQSAKLGLLKGKRHWDPEKASLVTCLSAIMRSIASHILKKENRHFDCPLEETAETEFSRKDFLPTYLEVCDELRHLTSGNPILSRIVELYIEDSTRKPLDMLELMPDVSMNEIRKAFRWLNDLTHRLKKERKNGPES